MARYWSDGYEEINTVGHVAEYRVTVLDKERWDGKQNALTFDDVPTIGSSSVLTSGVIAITFENMNRYVHDSIKEHDTDNNAHKDLREAVSTLSGGVSELNDKLNNLPEDAVTDVKVNGASIVGENGVAEIPKLKVSHYNNILYGLPALNDGNKPVGIGIAINGSLMTLPARREDIKNRVERDYFDTAVTGADFHNPICPGYIDYAVKAAMCDGKGEAWTDEEKAASRERTGSASSEEVQSAKETADNALSIAKGRATAYIFETTAELDTKLQDTEFVSNLVKGDNLYIKAIDEPDYWWDGTEKQPLETEKPDLTNVVKGVQIGGTSIVGEDGVAEIPIAERGRAGVMACCPNNMRITYVDGVPTLYLETTENAAIDRRYSSGRHLSTDKLDYAVEKVMGAPIGDGMIDGVFHYPAWSEATQKAAIERIGLKDYAKYKYFNFIEAGVNVEGNPTYDEIKEAVLSDVTPVLIHGHYIATMTSGHWDAEAFEREELPGFTFVTHRSDMNNHWKIKYTEFWCTKQDDGSTLWAVSEHYYIEDFVAEYGVTTFDEIQNAYNHEKIMFCTHGGLVTKLDIFAPDSYAQFSGLDDMGNPALLKVTKDNVWSRTNVTNATTDYVNSEINDLNTTHIVPLTSKIDSFGQYITGKYPMLSALSSMNAVDILKSVYSFRGGFCDNAGTLHIKNPGIYLIIAGGTSNKTITINYPTGKEFEATKWNGIILLAYESGAVTPIGIKSSPLFADAFQLPGTFQGWTSDGRYSTTINYPGGCVVSYLGNSNVDYLS